ncbi:MAG: hypothetical protein Q8P13_02290 [bacterium]|nr:hypothetical protein [bacterium]
MRPAVSFTSYLLRLPIDFVVWWFLEATVELIQILIYIFRAFLQLLSIDSIFKTFFKPWKNEYREGLTRFATFFGVGLKSLLLVFDAFFLVGLIAIEASLFLVWVVLPFIFFWGIYASIFR